MRTGRPPTMPELRFFTKVVEDGDCWLWTADRDRGGYGSFWDGKGRQKAHRWSYQFLRGEIPAGLQLDHLCRQPSCVNPWHLEPVTAQVNVLRGTSFSAAFAAADTCVSGHPLERSGDRRICRTCRRAADARYKAGVSR